MQIEPATCPVCSALFDPLLARAVAVMDGRVRAFCSDDCKARGRQGVDRAPSVEEALQAVQQPSAWKRLPREQKILGGAVGVVAVLVGVVFVGRGPTMHATTASAAMVMPA